MHEEKLIWQTKEFRDAKKKAVAEGKLKNKCEWCRAKEELVPHHTISFKTLIHSYLRKLAIAKMSHEQGFRFTNSALTKSGGFSTDKGYIRETALKEFIKQNKELYEIAKSTAKEEYLAFNDIQTLCKRCHQATEHGMVLCQYCKKKYHNLISFSSCFNCKEKRSEDMRKFEERMDEAEREAFEFHKSKIKE